VDYVFSVCFDGMNATLTLLVVASKPLYHFSNEICNNNPMLRDAEKCTFDNWLNALYENSMYKHKGFFEDSENKAKILGTKINIEQIPTEFYPDLGAFLHCTKETSIVLQVTRAASIASFLNYQVCLSLATFCFVRHHNNVLSPLRRL